MKVRWWIKKLFGGFGKKGVTSPKASQFDNINAYLDGSADLNINTLQDSRSTAYLKEASDIIITDHDFPEHFEETDEVMALQSFIGKNDEIREIEHIAIVPEEEFALKN